MSFYQKKEVELVINSFFFFFFNMDAVLTLLGVALLRQTT